MPRMFIDDEGNEYTEEQVREAVRAKVADEAGEGSFGGLAEDDALQPSRTSPRDDSDVDALVEAATTQPRAERELDPRKFGDFFRSNVFGGLDAKYVTGKRPMTAFDYATDVLAAYGGEDIGKRNAQLIKTDTARRESTLKSLKAGQDVKTARAREEQANASARKTGLETQKLVEERLASIFEEVDSDLWEPRMKELEKETGVELPGTTRKMVMRWMEKAREAGVSNPSEVLANPDQYDPGFVNRTRHTFKLITKGIEESQARQANVEQSKAAAGVSRANQEASERTSEGIEDAIAELETEAQSGDPNVARRARYRIAALNAGGEARNQVLAELSGVKTGGERGLVERGYIERAKKELGPEADPAGIAERVATLKAQDRASGELRSRSARNLADKITAVSVGKATLDEMAKEIQALNPGKSGIEGRLYTWLRQKGGRLVGNPQTAVVDSLSGDMVNVARTLGGEKGPLTEGDVRRIEIAIKFNDGDTLETWFARYEKAKRIADAGLRALQEAQAKGLDEPRKLRIDSSLNIVGAGNDSERAAAAQAIRAERDPERKRQLAAEYVRRFPK